MKLAPADLSELAELAISAAHKAGEMIARSRPQEIEHKAEGASLASQVVTEIDRHSEDIILEMLRPTLEPFELGLLSEEQDDDGGRLTADYFWCIDPLDGTLPFVEGRPGYSVSIGLVGRDGTPWIGVVYDPTEAMLLHAIRGAGAFRDREPWLTEPQSSGGVLSVFADRSFVARADLDDLVDGLENIARAMGLAGVRLDAIKGGVMNACSVLVHGPACYFKYPKASDGGGGLWDFAASACLFHEMGAVATDIEGGALDLNRADSTSMSHRGVLFATDEQLAKQIRSLRSSPT